MKPFSCQNSRIWGHSFSGNPGRRANAGNPERSTRILSIDWGATATGWAAAGLAQPPGHPLGVVGREGGRAPRADVRDRVTTIGVGVVRSGGTSREAARRFAAAALVVDFLGFQQPEHPARAIETTTAAPDVSFRLCMRDQLGVGKTDSQYSDVKLRCPPGAWLRAPAAGRTRTTGERQADMAADQTHLLAGPLDRDRVGFAEQVTMQADELRVDFPRQQAVAPWLRRRTFRASGAAPRWR